MKNIINILKIFLIKIPIIRRQIEKIAYFNYVKRGYKEGFNAIDWFEAERDFYSILVFKGLIYPIIIGFLVALSWHLFDVIKPYNICLSEPYASGKKITYHIPLPMHLEDDLRVGILNENVRSLKSPLLYLYFPTGVIVEPVFDKNGPNWSCWEPSRVYFMALNYNINHKYVNSLTPLHIKFPNEGIYTIRYAILGEDLITVNRLIRLRVSR